MLTKPLHSILRILLIPNSTFPYIVTITIPSLPYVGDHLWVIQLIQTLPLLYPTYPSYSGATLISANEVGHQGVIAILMITLP